MDENTKDKIEARHRKKVEQEQAEFQGISTEALLLERERRENICFWGRRALSSVLVTTGAGALVWAAANGSGSTFNPIAGVGGVLALAGMVGFDQTLAKTTTPPFWVRKIEVELRRRGALIQQEQA